MNIDKCRNQHGEIMQCIAVLKKFAKEGISRNAAEIARIIVPMSSTIKLYLAMEDQALRGAS